MVICGFDWPAGRTKQVLATDNRYHIQEFCVGMGGHWHRQDLTAMAGAPLVSDVSDLVGYAWTAGQCKQAVYMDRNRHIQELFLSMDGHWQVADLTALTGAPLVNGSKLAAYEWIAAGTKQVVYVDCHGHIQEMHVGMGGQWQVTDLTALTNAPMVQGATLTGFAWEAAGCKQVVYVDINGHIQELSVSMGGHWQVNDLTELTDAPLADRGVLCTPLTGFCWTAGQSKHIVYRDREGHIQELHMSVGGHWQLADLTLLTHAPLANSIGGLSGYEWQAGQAKQVVYTDNNYHIQELYVGMGGQWQVTDLTALTGAPILQQGPIVGYPWSAAESKQVVYLGPRESIQELHVGMGGQWQVADLSVITDSLMLV